MMKRSEQGEGKSIFQLQLAAVRKDGSTLLLSYCLRFFLFAREEDAGGGDLNGGRNTYLRYKLLSLLGTKTAAAMHTCCCSTNSFVPRKVINTSEDPMRKNCLIFGFLLSHATPPHHAIICNIHSLWLAAGLRLSR
jgi:hypothetical protein